MSLKLIAVDGMTVEIESSAPTISATIVVLPPTGTKGKAEGKLVHRDGDKILVSVIKDDSAGASVPDPLTYEVPLNASISKDKELDELVLVEGDESDVINANPLKPGPPQAKYPVSFKCIITDPNQSTVRGQ
jgi:hypothetical protein